MPTEQELATEKKMRGLTAEMNKAEGLKMLEILLERTGVDDIIEAIRLAKLSDEVDKIQLKL